MGGFFQSDYVLLPTHAGFGVPLDFVTVRSAKGGGYLALPVGALVFYNDYWSPVPPQLLAEAAARTAVNNYLEGHDCWLLLSATLSPNARTR